MKKYKSILPALLVMLTLTIVSALQNDAKGQNDYVQGIWTGTVSMHQKFSNLIGWNELWIDINFVENRGTGTLKYETELIVDGKSFGKVSCYGAGKAELNELIINRAAGTYSFQALAPSYTCKPANEDMGAGTRDISIVDQPLGTNPNLLSGSETIINDLGVAGKGTTTITWNLHQGPIDVELIVTPSKYDTWLPEPGRDETTVGSIMNISLKLQGKNGKPLSLKAKAFELRLSNTSQEPGITINYPISPRANQLPDLSFMQQPDAKLLEDSQFIKISCPGCVTTNVKVGSYDGGGWTTLTATAILEDSTRIEGELIKPGGERNIRIPKREPTSIIATSWLIANGNPGEMDDIEKSPENKNNGDGLTAYEEYRGVITFGQFQRLEPKIKELGFLVKRSEIELFSGGISRFQNASHIWPVYFDRNEIPDNRRINQNAKTAHDFDQFVLRINKGNTSQLNIPGYEKGVFGIAIGGVNIPAKVTHIVIDVDRIRASYQKYAAAYGAARLPYSEMDMIASTTAHEIGHGVNLPHHSIYVPNLPGFIAPKDTVPRIRIFSGGAEITTRPYNIAGSVGSPGNFESGDVTCFMCYRNKTNYVRKIDNNNDLLFYRVPELAAGSIFCNEKTGTGINAGNNYFGNARANAECLKVIKLRN